MVTERNKFNTFQETSERHTLNDEYENFVTGLMKIVDEWIPSKSQKKSSRTGNSN